MAALGFYTAHTLRPLLEILRIRHCPERFDFGAKYSAPDLPSDVVRRFERLHFVGSLDDVATRRIPAEEWFTEPLRQSTPKDSNCDGSPAGRRSPRRCTRCRG
jgi:hypothetical protein